jgi:hypothetical protein
MRLFVLVLIGLIGSLVRVESQSLGQPPFNLNDQNQLKAPDPQVYHQWPRRGVGSFPHELNEGRAMFSGVHLVFQDPISAQHYQETRFFPDGTVLVMEVLGLRPVDGPSGKGGVHDATVTLLVQIKDRRKFSGSGWAYFLFDEPSTVKTAQAPQHKSKCQSCHVAAAPEDEVFTDFYPVLDPKP